MTSFISVPGDDTLKSHCNLYHSKYISKSHASNGMVRKNGCILQIQNIIITEHWNTLPREAVESPSLETFKTHPDKVLCSLL